MVTGLCHFVIFLLFRLFAWCYCTTKRRKNATRKDEKTPHEKKNEIMPGKKTTYMYKRERLKNNHAK